MQIAHGIDPADIAALLSVSISQYLNRLNRLNLARLTAAADSQKRSRDAILERLQTELTRLLEGGDLPVKSKSEALMALARAVKSVGELTAEDRPASQQPASHAVASLSDTRKALMRISRRIDELAQSPAREILDGENAANLAQGFVQSINERHGGTRLGRQELDGELIEERADALWSRDLIERCFETEAPELVRIVVAIDPPASSGKASDACGIVVAGLDDEGKGHVLGDAGMKAAKPHQWARKAISLFHAHQADGIVAEVNQSGKMVRPEDASVPVLKRHASRGKVFAGGASGRTL